MNIAIKSKDNTYFKNIIDEEEAKPDGISICVKTKNKIAYFRLYNINEVNPYIPFLHVKYKGIEYALWFDKVW